jgi:hypothetical protein
MINGQATCHHRTAMRSVTVVSAVLLAAACSRGDAGAVTTTAKTMADATTTEAIDVLRESARETLGANCGACHTRGLPTALPRALAVFDLDRLDWSTRMTDDQLREAQRRLDEPTAPSIREEERREIHLGAGERDRFARFVTAEIARRHR